MYQNYKKSQKEPAIALRKTGLSFSEIQAKIPVPKSTLSYWLKDIKLTRSQTTRLNQKKIQARVAGTQKKITQTRKLISEIERSSLSAIKEISKREFWLMGIMLYWREKILHLNKKDLQKGVRLSSADPTVIKFFLKWLEEAGRLKKEEIALDIFISSSKKAHIDGVIERWAKITGFPKKHFKHVYYLKTPKLVNPSPRKSYKKSPIGLLRIRVRASSMLARQLSGWIRAIQKYYWND